MYIIDIANYFFHTITAVQVYLFIVEPFKRLLLLRSPAEKMSPVILSLDFY